MTTIRTASIPDAMQGERIDKALAGLFPDLSRARLQSLIEDGYALLDGRAITRTSRKVKAGQDCALTIPESAPAKPEAQDIPLSIVYEDEHLLVIDKPAGLVVHPAAGNHDRTLVNALLAHCGDSLSGIGGVKRPGIVHRLDKHTSGLMVVAKHDQAHHALSAQFADRTLSRTYIAFTYGAPPGKSGEIIAAIGRHPRHRQRMAVLARGKDATTRWRVLARYGQKMRPFAGEIECKLLTGRTHQIRVHLLHIGTPVLGDPLYYKRGGVVALPEAIRPLVHALGRQALHAAELTFRHPATGKTLTFKSPLPPDLARLRKKLGEC